MPPPSDNPVPLLAADLLDALERHVQADPRIITAHVQGFPPTRPGDLYADILLFLGCDTKDSCQAITDNLANWIAPITRLFLTQRDKGAGFPSMRHCITEDGIRIDIQIFDASFARARPHGLVLKETPGHFDPHAKPIAYSQPTPADLLDRIEEFWSTFTLIGRALERDAVSFGYLAYLQLYRSAFNVLAHRGPQRAKLPFQNIILSPEDDRRLTATVRFDSLTPETLAREYLKLGTLIATHAPALCLQAGVEYPLPLQQAVLHRVHTELRMHNITP